MPRPANKLLLGLIGAGIGPSLTPALHEQEARCQGLQLHYQLIDLDHAPRGEQELPALLAAARTMGFDGLNITYPCKQRVIPLLDELSHEARAVNAVNTVVLHGGRAVGHNTDSTGWAWGFQRALPTADVSRVVLLGAGGAGAAVGHAALQLGVQHLCVVDADAARATQLAAQLGALHGAARVTAFGDVARAMDRATGLIHATPTGMAKLPGLPLPAALLHRGLWVSEIVYLPLDTPLLRAAREAGCATADGGTMAVGQALGAFGLFTGHAPDALRMEAHLRSMLAQRAATEAAAQAATPQAG